MTQTSTQQKIKERLARHFEPSLLEVIDESHLHVGHVGAQDGRGHYKVRIASDTLNGLSRMAQHRRIYEVVGELMKTEIHALNIEVCRST